MSKSLKRVRAYLQSAGLDVDIIEMAADTKTAAMAAAAVNCDIDQIAKSIIFLGHNSGDAILFLTAGGNRVMPDQAEKLVNEPLGKADADLIRAQTGFAIGGVSPVGHLNPIKTYMDRRLLEFPHIWAAAGTPFHMFQIEPNLLARQINATLAPPDVMQRPSLF